MNELCFVWGPPLSGQWRWMARSAQEADPSVVTTLLPLESYGPDVDLVRLLRQVEQKRSLDFGARPHHIYCELPWLVTVEDFWLEDWLARQTGLSIQRGFETERVPTDWNVSFLAICPNDAERLPVFYRKGMEEFARSSNSSVIVLTHDGNQEIPAWLGTDILDFGKRIEVFEEPLWPAHGEVAQQNHYFTNVETFDLLTLPLHGERDFYRNLFHEMAEGQHGAIWGAEATWRNVEGKFEAMTLTQGQMYVWQSEHASFLENCTANGASLNVAGFPVRRSELIRALQSQKLC